jgi:hypothetical protein
MKRGLAGCFLGMCKTLQLRQGGELPIWLMEAAAWEGRVEVGQVSLCGALRDSQEEVYRAGLLSSA